MITCLTAMLLNTSTNTRVNKSRGFGCLGSPYGRCFTCVEVLQVTGDIHQEVRFHHKRLHPIDFFFLREESEEGHWHSLQISVLLLAEEASLENFFRFEALEGGRGHLEIDQSLE